jgi:hypothetical protein
VIPVAAAWCGGSNKRESIMGELRRMCRRHMVLRGFSEKTIESYGHAMVELAKAYPGVSLDQLTKDQIQVHLLDLIQNRSCRGQQSTFAVARFVCFTMRC